MPSRHESAWLLPWHKVWLWFSYHAPNWRFSVLRLQCWSALLIFDVVNLWCMLEVSFHNQKHRHLPSSAVGGNFSLAIIGFSTIKTNLDRFSCDPDKSRQMLSQPQHDRDKSRRMLSWSCHDQGNICHDHAIPINLDSVSIKLVDTSTMFQSMLLMETHTLHPLTPAIPSVFGTARPNFCCGGTMMLWWVTFLYLSPRLASFCLIGGWKCCLSTRLFDTHPSISSFIWFKGSLLDCLLFVADA